jgi:hypothetical protein
MLESTDFLSHSMVLRRVAIEVLDLVPPGFGSRLWICHSCSA